MTTQKNNDPYGVFCVASHQYLSHIHELDLRWERANEIYNEFCESDYNVATKSELDCINEYMDFFYSNQKKYHNTKGEMHTIADLKEAIKNLDDNDVLAMETIDTETGDAIDLFPFYLDVIDGIKLNDGSVVREVRLCQLNNK